MQLEVRHLSKVYKENRGLLDTDFNVGKGELIAVVGHNGAGKSTALAQLSGELQPSSGRIFFNGEVVYDSRPRAKAPGKPVRIRKGVNTMLVQCLVHDEKPQDPGDFFFLFYDAGNGTRLSELVLDTSKR